MALPITSEKTSTTTASEKKNTTTTIETTSTTIESEKKNTTNAIETTSTIASTLNITYPEEKVSIGKKIYLATPKKSKIYLKIELRNIKNLLGI